jgi:hypothetical protein
MTHKNPNLPEKICIAACKDILDFSDEFALGGVKFMATYLRHRYAKSAIGFFSILDDR